MDHKTVPERAILSLQGVSVCVVVVGGGVMLGHHFQSRYNIPISSEQALIANTPSNQS